MDSQTLNNISNGGYSKANRNSFYNKQKESFQKNIRNYDKVKEGHVHKHVRQITEMFKSLTQQPTTKYNNFR